MMAQREPLWSYMVLLYGFIIANWVRWSCEQILERIEGFGVQNLSCVETCQRSFEVRNLSQDVAGICKS